VNGTEVQVGAQVLNLFNNNLFKIEQTQTLSGYSFIFYFY
jgi:hypothetical protein